MVGQTISHYRITGKVGEGGMGVVFRAEDLNLQRGVALKFHASHALDNAEARERFLREARAAASLDHPNVCTVYEIGEADGQLFLAMAFIDGQTVKERIAERPMKLDDALSIAVQAGEGLRAAHEKGIVHRDIKSSNLMVTADGNVKVMDFGLAQLSGQSGLTKSRTSVGTAAYMSPEQAQRRPVDLRTDIWSLGVVLYEMVTGRLPFEGEHEAAVLYSIVDSAPEPITALRVGVPAELDHVIAKAMAKDPECRYQHMADLLVDLRALQKGLPVSARAGRLNRRNLLIGTAAAVAAVGVGIRMGIVSSARGISSMVVLPLDNLSGDPNQEYFADGITDALITDLSKVSALRLISRQTSMKYKGSKKPLRDITRELNVDAVVGGSVARESDMVRVTAQLIDAATDQNLWGESYYRELASILALQSEVARTIAGKISVKLRPEEESRLTLRRKVNPRTYEAYLRGMFWLNKDSLEGIKKGLDYFHEAVENDPGDPLAYAGMALGYLRVAHGSNPPDHALPRALSAADTALKLDDTLAEVHAALGIRRGYRDWQWGTAQQTLDRALEINPSLAIAHFHKAWFHVFSGRIEQAIAELRRAQEIDPLTLDYVWGGDFYRLLGRYEDAIATAERALEMNSRLPGGHYVLAFTYADQGKHAEALAEYKKLAEVAPPMKWSAGYVLAKTGQFEEARRLLAEIEEQKVNPYAAFCLAALHAMLGNKDEAFRWLDYKPHHDWVPSCRVGNEFEPLRGDPRFSALMKRMNLPPV